VCTLFVVGAVAANGGIMVPMFELLMLVLAKWVNVAGRDGLVVVGVDGHGLEMVS